MTIERFIINLQFLFSLHCIYDCLEIFSSFRNFLKQNSIFHVAPCFYHIRHSEGVKQPLTSLVIFQLTGRRNIILIAGCITFDLYTKIASLCMWNVRNASGLPSPRQLSFHRQLISSKVNLRC